MSRIRPILKGVVVVAIAAVASAACSSAPQLDETQQASEATDYSILPGHRPPLPPICGPEGNPCCKGPDTPLTLSEYGPLRHCNQGLGCDIVNDRCVKPCGGAGQVCCDSQQTRAVIWDANGRISSPTSPGLLDMCSGTSCDKASHRCVACGSVDGASCCPPSAQQATASCTAPGLECQFDNYNDNSGVCHACGTVGKPPCASGCNPGLDVFNGVCDVCGSAGKRPCNSQYCDHGCKSPLHPSGGLCQACGAEQQPACDPFPPTALCRPGQSACNPGLVPAGGRCVPCGSAGATPCDNVSCNKGCKEGLVLQSGICVECGTAGHPVCEALHPTSDCPLSQSPCNPGFIQDFGTSSVCSACFSTDQVCFYDDECCSGSCVGASGYGTPHQRTGKCAAACTPGGKPVGPGGCCQGYEENQLHICMLKDLDGCGVVGEGNAPPCCKNKAPCNSNNANGVCVIDPQNGYHYCKPRASGSSSPCPGGAAPQLFGCKVTGCPYTDGNLENAYFCSKADAEAVEQYNNQQCSDISCTPQ
jgi:hypothetical protein